MSGALGGRLRLLMVTARYFPFKGGIETHVHEVSRRLAASNVDVTVLTCDPTGQLPREEHQAGVRIRRVRSWPAQEDFYLAPELYGVIRRGGWDLVHVQGSHTFVPPLAMLAARHARIPYIVTFHTGTHSSALRNSLRWLQWAALKPLFRHADRLVAVSQFEAAYFSRTLSVPVDRFRWIPNGSDLPNPTAADRVDAGGPLILSVGRLERYKGHHRVIAAMPHILQRRPDARLWILGSGPFEPDLRRQIDSLGLQDSIEIRMIPAEQRRTMAGVLASAKLVVLLSDGESHPVAIMEALALGARVLVADTPGLHELAERRLVQAIPVDTPPVEVAEAVVHCLAQSGVIRPLRLPTWDDCAAALLEVYTETAPLRRLACAS
jgi:glycosyltransferase involved in cell wall biosynthesis